MKLDPTVFTIDNVTLMFKALRSYCLFLLKEGNTEQLASVVNCIDCSLLEHTDFSDVRFSLCFEDDSAFYLLVIKSLFYYISHSENPILPGEGERK